MKRCGSDDVENNNVDGSVFSERAVVNGFGGGGGGITMESKKSKLFR